MRQTTALGLLACVLALGAMAAVKAQQGVGPGPAPALVSALGASQPDAPLARSLSRDVRARIDRRGFRVAAPKTRVSLHGLGTGNARWARFSHGVMRQTPFGSETILVKPRKAEQFLTVENRQGPRTWRWRLDAPKLRPRVGDDGAVTFVDGHTFAGLHVEPVAVLDEAGRDVTPDGLEWTLGRDRKGWLLELDLDDSKLPQPYVIDPAIVLHEYASEANNGAGSASLKIYKPIGTTANDFLLAMISMQGNRTITAPSGWTSVRRTTQGAPPTLTQEIFRKVAVNNEPASYTFTFSASDNATGGIIPYIGVNNASPIDASSGNPSSANSTNITALSVNTTAADHMVVGFFGYNASRTFTPPGGMTERWDAASNATSTEAADYVQVAAGATGNKVATASGNAQAWIGQLVALKLDVTSPTQSVSVTEGARPDLEYFDSATNTMYYNPAAAGDFTVTSDLTDVGASQVTFPAISATGFTHTAEYQKQVLADEPLAYWRLGEGSGTSAADSSGNGNTGTYTNAPTLGAAGALAGDGNTAVGFDGVNDQVSVPSNAVLNLNESFSIEFWAKQTSFTNSFPGIINKGSSSTANGYLIFAGSTGALTFKRNNISTTTTAGALTSSYKHFVLIYDGTYAVWFINGVQNTVGVVTYPTNASAAAISIGLGDPGQYGNNVVDELAIYQTALGLNRMTAHYNAGLTAGGDDVDTHTPYTSTSYNFTNANAVAPAAQNVVGEDGAGNQVTTSLAFNRDINAPTGMSATVTAGYYTSLSVPVTLANGGDTGAGIDAASAVVERDEVALAADSCGGFTGTWTTVTLSGGNDTGVQSGKCYRYRYKISDRVGNQGTQAGTSATAKIDTSAPTPAPTLSYGSFSNAALSGGIVYYRPGAATGQFAVSAAGSSDPESAVAGYNFPAAAGGWSRSIVGATSTYSHTGSPTDPVEPLNVTASNNAGLNSAASTFTVTPDSSAPTGHSLALSGGPYYTSLSVALTPTDGSDTGSGIDTSTRAYERDEGTLSGGSCSGFPGTYGTTVSNPDSSVQSGRCYRYRLKISDRVGNQSAASSPTADAKVDTSAPSDPTLGFGSFSAASATGSTVYFRPGAASGQFAVTASSTDAESGVASYSFPAAAAGWSRSIAGATATYSHTGSPTDPAEPLNVTSTNNAGLSSGASGYSVTPDSSLPSTAIQCDGVACSSGWYTTSPVSITLSASDTGSGLSQIKYTTDGSDPTLANGTVYAGAFNLAATATVKYRAWDNVGNSEAVQSKLVQIDSTAPSAPGLSFSALTNAAATGQTVYFKTGAAGGFTVTGSSSDPESGVASYAFPSLGSGWSGSQAGASYTYSFTNAAADPSEPNNVTATNNAGLTSGPSSVTVTPDGSAPVSSILCDGASCAGGWYTSGVSVSLSASDSGSGLQEIRYTTDGSDPSPVNGTVYAAPFSVFGTTTIKFRSYDRVGNEEAVGSQLVQVDTTAPTAPSLTLTETPASTNQHVSGTTVYYNPQGSNAGTFTVDAATGDPQSGIEKVTFPAVAGMTGGGDDLTSPYQGLYSWTSSTSATGAQTATARNNAGLTATGSFTITPDTSTPTGQTAALVGGPYYTSASVGFTTGDGSDSGSGLNTSSRLVERASATLTNGSCGGFGGYGGSYTSPDASVLSGNCYRYRFTIADNVGNVSTAIVTADAKVDTSAPSATMNDPGANLRGTVTLTSAASDSESGVATVAYQRSPAGAGTWTATPAGWDTTGVADGLYDLRVVVTNGAGVSTTSAIVANRRVDNTAPSATMDNPGTPLSGTVTLTATASDAGSGLNTGTFQYSLNGTGPWTNIGSDPSAPFGVNWDTTTVADGRYSLRVIVTDAAGNTTTSAAVVNRQVQNNPPFVDLTAPGSYINAASPSPFTVTANAVADPSVANVEFFRCDNASVNCSSGSFLSIGVDTTAPYSASWAQASEPEGNRALKAVVTGTNFSTNADVLNVTIDRTAPSGSITAPGAGAYVGGATAAVSSDSADGLSGVAQVVFERSPAGAGTWTPIGTDTVAPYSVSWNTTSLSDGAYDLRAVTSDLAGNSFNGSVRTVNVDNTGPTASQDDPGANLRATVTLTGSAADPAGIAQVVFQRSPAGAGTWTTIDTDTSAPYSASFDTTAVSDGLYDFRVVAADTLGNPTSSAPVTSRRVDNTSPTATQDDPGANLRATVTLTGSAADSGGSGVAQVVFQRSPAGAGTWATIDTDTSAPYSASFDTTAVADGIYDLRVVATDVAGNVANSAPVANRRVDNTPPSATMNDPGANLSGTVTLTSITSDGGSGIAGVTYQYSQTGQNNWITAPANWDTTLVGDGLYDLRVTAADQAGNTATSAPVTNRQVDNGAPTVSITSPAAYVSGSDPDPFTVTASSPDTDLTGVQFFACDNGSTGCATGNWVSLGTDPTAPYSASWALPGADGNRALRAVATDNASNTGQDVHDVTIDRAAPSGGSVSYLDGYDTTGSLTITTADGSDSGTGIDPASRVLQRDSASLSAGACDPFTGSWAPVTNPDSVASGTCVRYRYRLADFAGNVATYTSASVAKVDTSAPSAPSFAFSALTNAVASGQTVYFRPGVAGGFRVTASSSDPESGVASYAFPALGSGWSGSQSGAAYDYDFGASAADPAEPNNGTATNNAGIASGPTSFTVTADGVAPVSSILCDGASCEPDWYTSTVSISLSAVDSGSGLGEIRYTTDGSDPSPVNGTVYSAPFDVSVTTTIKFRAYDLLGNEEPVGSQFVRIDTSAPAAPALSYGSFQNAVVTGGIVWYRPSAVGGQFAVTASSSDNESGIAGYTFPAPASGWVRSISGATATYSHSGSPADPLEPNDVTAQNNAGLSSGPTSFTADPDGTPPASAIACDGAACSSGWYPGAVSVSLSATDAASGLAEIRYTTDGSDPSPTNGTVYSGAFAVPSTATVRYRAYDRVGNEEAVGQQLIRIDSSAPAAPALTLSESPASPNQHVSGTTLFYNPQGSYSGSFTVDAATSDPGSGIDRVSFAPLTGMTGGGDDFSAPYRATYAWDGSSSAAGAQSVVAHNNAGLTSSASFDVTPDTTAPSGQSVDADDGPYYTTLSVPLTLQPGSDAGAGIDASSGIVERQSATLANDSCSGWSAGWTVVTLSGGADTSVVSGNCYRYRYFISDNVGNQSSASPLSSTAEVDTSAPSAPTFSFSALTNAAANGQTVYFRPGVAGGFRMTGLSSDAESGVASYVFPALGSGWSGSQNGANYDYSFSSSAVDPAEPNNGTATNNAGLVSGPASFTVTADGTAPVGSILCDGASCEPDWYTSTVSISLSASDSGSGLQEIRYTTDGSDPSPVNGTVYAAPFDVSATTTVKFRAYDLLGNEEPVGTQLIRFDNTAPSAPALTLTESPASAGQHVSGTTLYYNPQGSNSGTFTVDAATNDPQSGIEKVTFAALTGMTGGGDDPASPYQGVYSWTSASSASGAQAVVSRNNAGLTANASFTVTPDTAAPSGGSVDYADGYTGGPVTITTDPGSDALSGLDAGSQLIERDSATLSAGVCGPFAGSWSTVSSPDATIVSGRCYRYRFSVSDNVGNSVVYTSPNVVKVSTAGPSTPVLTLSETPADPDQHVSGTTLYYNPSGANAGTFTVTAVANDPVSGIDRLTFPAIAGMTGGGDDLTSPYGSSYDWTAATSASGARTVTARSNAGLTSSETFTVAPDTTAPAGQTADTDFGPYYTTLSVPLTLTPGSDAGAGIDASSGVVERQSATLSNDACSGWSGWVAVTLSGGADTTVATDHCYRYRYFISDNVGNQSPASPDSGDAKVDVDAPVTGDDAPAGWRNAAVTVTLTPVDSGSGIDWTRYRVDGGAFLYGTSISIPAPGDHSNDGVHTIEYASTDNAGNAEPQRTATVRIDTTVPATTDDAPAGWRNADVTVTLTPADALSGIASTQYRVDGGAFQSGVSISIPAPGDHSNDGVHTIEYASTDNAGNTEPLRTATVRIDTQLPSGALTAPADGAHVNGTVAISASANDLPSGVASVEFLVRPNGSGSFSTISTDTTAPYDAVWDSTSSPEGDAELKVVVLDNAGLSFASALRTVVVDNPPAPTLGDPGANVSGLVTLTASSQPDTAQVVFERSPAGAGTWTQIAADTSAPFSADFDTTSVAEGTYDLRVVATDLGGFNGTSPLRSARVDNTAPAVSVSEPANGAVVGGPNVHLAALASDSGSGVASVRFEQRQAGGGSFTAIATDGSEPFEASWDTTGLNGSYELRAVAADAAGNAATAATVTVSVDSSAASITLGDPGALLRDVVALSASAPSLAVASVAFERRASGEVAWTRISRDTARPWGAAFDTKDVADGLYDLRAQALDGSSQVLATHVLEAIRIDNTAPRLASSRPADGATVSSATGIVLETSEPVTAVRDAALDGSAAAASIEGETVTFATGPLGAGEHALSGTLVDAAGNSGAFAVHFKVKVKAQATFVVRVGNARAVKRGDQRVFLVPLSLSAPAKVQATLLSPSGRRLRRIRVRMDSGRHSLRFSVPADSLPPGRYTVLIVATAADGTRVVKRVPITVARSTTSEPVAEQEQPPAVMIPAAPSRPDTPGPSSEPAPKTKPQAKPTTSRRAPKPRVKRPQDSPLETASSYVGSKPGKSLGLVLLLFALGAALAYLVKVEIERLLSSTRRSS